MTRRRATAILLSALVGLVSIAALDRAAALEQEGFVLPPRTTLELDFPPIPAPEPASVTVGGVVGPDECAALPSCHLVQFEVEAPEGLETGDDFYIRLHISWQATSGSEDLDTFVYDDGQTTEAEGSSGYTEIGSSASADNPEIIQVYEPLLGTYNLVVQNFTGVAVAWHLKAESIVGEFVAPIELLAPGPGSGTKNPDNKPTTTTTRPTTTTTEATTTTVSIPEGVVLADDDFDGGAFDPEAAFADQQAAIDELEALRDRAAPSSPSALSVVLWMVAFPLALVGAALLALRARRRGTRRRRRAAAPAEV